MKKKRNFKVQDQVYIFDIGERLVHGSMYFFFIFRPIFLQNYPKANLLLGSKSSSKIVRKRMMAPKKNPKT